MPSDPFSRRALYQRAARAERERARRAWKSLDLVKVIDEARKTHGRLAHGKPTARLDYALREFQKGGPNAALRMLAGASFGGLINDVIRYGKRDQNLLNKWLSSLGAVGKTIKLIADAIGGKKKHADPDVSAALNLLQALGYETLPPPSAKAPQTEKERAIEAAKQLLAQEGYVFTRPGKKVDEAEDQPPMSAPQPSQPGRKTVDVTMGSGGTRRFPVNHPIYTRERIYTPESSNVQWFSYDEADGTLYIRYQFPGHGGRPTHRDGPLYAYSHVPPEIFLGMMRAPSKGGFVWTHIRQLGTVSGHQYDYRLVAVTGGYVPRKATLRHDGEWFEMRQVRTINRQGQVKVQRSGATMPAYSAPNRGGPNRGRPNRGR